MGRQAREVTIGEGRLEDDKREDKGNAKLHQKQKPSMYQKALTTLHPQNKHFPALHVLLFGGSARFCSNQRKTPSLKPGQQPEWSPVSPPFVAGPP